MFSILKNLTLFGGSFSNILFSLQYILNFEIFIHGVLFMGRAAKQSSFWASPKTNSMGGNGSKSDSPDRRAGPSLNAEDKYLWHFSKGQGHLIERQSKLKNLGFLSISRIFDQS